jgi:hypothetical protein
MHSGLFSAHGGAHSYCGPTAIAAVTGLLVEEVENAVLAYRAEHPKPKAERMGRARVKAMWLYEVERVLERLGFDVEMTFDGHGCVRDGAPLPTFSDWLRLTKGGRGGRYVVLVKGHFVAVSDGWFVDTFKREPVRLSAVRKFKRSRMCFALRVTRKITTEN